MNPIYSAIYQLQEITLLTWRALRALFRPPLYWNEMLRQMDVVGVGSLAIIALTGTFTGGVLALNSANALQRFGFTNQTGLLVATSLIRELGPVFTCIVLAGRIGSGIAAELGSMIVSEQIDAMRALGTDPIKKLVIPRILALALMAPVLTVVSDMMGIFGGMFVAISQMHQASTVYLASVQQALTIDEITGGLIKPVVFGFIIAIIGCYMGLSTQGGTVGVGRNTTRSVVISLILIIVVDFLLTKLLIATILGYE
jgi:phospholipid/cholesterol/gamma-HCH transport system permease protein